MIEINKIISKIHYLKFNLFIYPYVLSWLGLHRVHDGKMFALELKNKTKLSPDVGFKAADRNSPDIGCKMADRISSPETE